MRLNSKVSGKNHIQGDQIMWIGEKVGVGRFSGINSIGVEKEKKPKEKAKRKAKKKSQKKSQKKKKRKREW